MITFSKEATNKDDSLKIQMMVSLNDDKADSSSAENIWKANWFLGDQRPDLTIIKANFLENTLVYMNNGSIYVNLVQILLVINFPDNLDNYQYEENEVLLYIPP